MAQIIDDPVVIADYYMNSPVLQKPRLPANPDDFGDQRTVGISLMRGSRTTAQLCRDFGLWLGEHSGKFVIGIFGTDKARPFIAVEVYDSLEEVHQKWTLD